jgi:hypothetical protein
MTEPDWRYWQQGRGPGLPRSDRVIEVRAPLFTM